MLQTYNSQMVCPSTKKIVPLALLITWGMGAFSAQGVSPKIDADEVAGWILDSPPLQSGKPIPMGKDWKPGQPMPQAVLAQLLKRLPEADRLPINALWHERQEQLGKMTGLLTIKNPPPWLALTRIQAILAAKGRPDDQRMTALTAELDAIGRKAAGVELAACFAAKGALLREQEQYPEMAHTLVGLCAIRAAADTQTVEVSPKDSVKSAVFEAVPDGETKTFTTLPKSEAPDLGQPGLVVHFVKEENRMIAWGRQATNNWMVSRSTTDEFTVKSPPLPAGSSSWVVCAGRFSQLLVTDNAWKRVPDKIPWKSSLDAASVDHPILMLVNAYPIEDCRSHFNVVKAQAAALRGDDENNAQRVVIAYFGGPYVGDGEGHKASDLGNLGTPITTLADLGAVLDNGFSDNSKISKVIWFGHGSPSSASDTGVLFADPANNSKKLPGFVLHSGVAGNSLDLIAPPLATHLLSDGQVEFRTCHGATIDKRYAETGGKSMAEEVKATFVKANQPDVKVVALKDGEVAEGLSLNIPILDYLFNRNPPTTSTSGSSWVSF